MPDKGNDIGSRIKHVGAGKHAVPAKSVFGTPEEIGNRVGGTFRTLVDNHPTNFRQLGPEGKGGNANDQPMKTKSGNAKFGSPRKYTG